MPKCINIIASEILSKNSCIFYCISYVYCYNIL